MTSKLQITIPKAIASRYAITPGDELEFVPADGGIRLVPAARPQSTPAQKLSRFDAAVARQAARNREWTSHHREQSTPIERGWTRAELYDRDRPR